jgi:hypothetical protein
LLPVNETRTGTVAAGRLERMTFEETKDEVPAPFVAVANALK